MTLLSHANARVRFPEMRGKKNEESICDNGTYHVADRM